MKAGELKEMTNEELLNKEGELKNELFNLRFQAASGQIENPMRIKAVKKDIARIETILREKELESQRGDVE